jgi:hypothetical protein
MKAASPALARLDTTASVTVAFRRSTGQPARLLLGPLRRFGGQFLCRGLTLGHGIEPRPRVRLREPHCRPIHPRCRRPRRRRLVAIRRYGRGHVRRRRRVSEHFAGVARPPERDSRREQKARGEAAREEVGLPQASGRRVPSPARGHRDGRDQAAAGRRQPRDRRRRRSARRSSRSSAPQPPLSSWSQPARR